MFVFISVNFWSGIAFPKELSEVVGDSSDELSITSVDETIGGTISPLSEMKKKDLTETSNFL